MASSFVVHVKRPEDVERGRENLPIVMMEQEIMEAINENSAVIVCGETGCGKTTQVPQFLYEAGYGSSLCKERAGMIGVTQPRRVAVLGTARRVAYELNVKLGQEVGFQVRHDRKLGENSCIKFMTDGILLRELQADFLLRKYSAIVLDEAHERSLNTDILIGMLSRIVPLRQKLHDQQCHANKKMKLDNEHQTASDQNAVTPLKLIIMSATLRVEDFTENTRMFPTAPPVLRVPARQFPVSIHFSRKTELIDYMGSAYKKVCAIHRKLPPGGILVFATGQREVEDLCRKLRKAFQPGRRSHNQVGNMLDCSEFHGEEQCPDKTDDLNGLNMERISAAMDGESPTEGQSGNLGLSLREGEISDDELECDLSESDDESDLEFNEDDPPGDVDALENLRHALYPSEAKPNINPMESISDESKDVMCSVITPDPLESRIQEAEPNKSDAPKAPSPLHVLPLYAMLPAVAQLRVFSGFPKGRRLVVVATNVAETSITIPGVRYVVDCGRAKERVFDRSSGIAKYEVQWISKASADQRGGRAGRTGPGHCYRLYSSAHFNDNFPKFSTPEISKSPIEGVVLVMKCMGIDKVANFPFPTPPEHAAVVEAEQCLKSLSALSSQTGALTQMGKAMAVYPISPRHSRMLLAAVKEAQELTSKMGDSEINLALAYAVAVAAALSLEDPFLREAVTMEEEVLPIDDSVLQEKTAGSASASDSRNCGGFKSAEQNQNLVEAEKAKRKSRRAKAHAAHLKFRNVSSDAVSVANALRAYEQAGDPEVFCQVNFLHAKTMSEMSKLRKQLWDLLISNSSDTSSKLLVVESKDRDCSWNKDLLAKSEICWHEPDGKKLNPEQEELVRRAVCAGWADKVSRKLSAQERATIPEAWHRRKVVGYRTCSLEDPVFLHPSSTVCKEAPEFVVYNELVHTSRIHMQRVTAVDSKWLVRQAEALCTFSKPLSDPPPWYDSLADEVMCWVTPSFGYHLWELPLHKIPLKKGKHRTAVFACALLQGKVLPSFSSLYPFLTNDPNIILKPESQALKRVSELMYRLGNVIDTRAKLRIAWAKEANFLYAELLSWVQSSHQMKVKEIFEHMQREVQMTGEELFSKRKR